MIRSSKFFAVISAAALSLAAVLPAKALTPSFANPPVQRATYSAAAVGIAIPQTGAMDAVCIAGAANKIIRIKRISISGIDATAQTATANLVLRSAANSGGTSTSPTVVPLDSTNAAGAAVVKAYTVAPTPGTAIGSARSASIGFGAATAASAQVVTWTFDPNELYQEIILRSAAQQACLNFPNAFTTAGPTINVDLTWTEQ